MEHATIGGTDIRTGNGVTMAEVRIYIGLENIALTNGQRNQLVAHLQSLGLDNNGPSPARRNHWRIRPDNDAMIMEAAFDDATVSIAAVKTRLGLIFSVDPAQISHSIVSPAFGGFSTTVITFTYLATQRLRIAVFGTMGGTWQQSNAEVRGYLLTNAAVWGDG